jgi:hypothetical protein
MLLEFSRIDYAADRTGCEKLSDICQTAFKIFELLETSGFNLFVSL